MEIPLCPIGARPNRCSSVNHVGLVVCLILCFAAVPVSATADATVNGSLLANGKAVELPYVYVWAEKEGFYAPSDPTWNILFVEHELQPRELGKTIWDTAWIHIGITETAEFTEQEEIQVYSQSIKFSADSAGNVSGGEYPQLEISGFGSDRVTGRIWHTELQEFFDDSYQFDLSFSAPVSDPDAPIGDVLPAGGGEPGQAYLTWVETVHSGDIEKLKRIVPPELATQLDTVSPEEASEEIEFMKSMTPTGVAIISGSSDQETALLQIEGLMEGEKIAAEVTMTRMGEIWLPTNFSM